MRKVYRRPVRAPGLYGSVRHLLRPQHQEIVAVDGIDLRIEQGEAVGYVGPNGAGKSTTIKLLTGIIRPTAGTVRALGRDPYRERLANARDIAAAFGNRSQLNWDLPLGESLALLRDIYAVPEDRYRENLRTCVDILGIEGFLNAPVRQLSLGQRMRADLTAALLHDPKILYLDEPTVGLDVAVKERLRAFLRQLHRERGLTILLTTHDLPDIEDVCNRLVIIDQARILYDGTLQQVRDRFARERVLRFVVRRPGTVDAAQLVAGCGPVRAAWQGDALVVAFDRLAVDAPAITARMLQALDVVDFHMEETGIEDVVRRVYERQLDLGQGVGPG